MRVPTPRLIVLTLLNLERAAAGAEPLRVEERGELGGDVDERSVVGRGGVCATERRVETCRSEAQTRV
jgi:hypothetical protein